MSTTKMESLLTRLRHACSSDTTDDTTCDRCLFCEARLALEAQDGTYDEAVSVVNERLRAELKQCRERVSELVERLSARGPEPSGSKSGEYHDGHADGHARGLEDGMRHQRESVAKMRDLLLAVPIWPYAKGSGYELRMDGRIYAGLEWVDAIGAWRAQLALEGSIPSRDSAPAEEPSSELRIESAKFKAQRDLLRERVACLEKINEEALRELSVEKGRTMSEWARADVAEAELARVLALRPDAVYSPWPGPGAPEIEHPPIRKCADCGRLVTGKHSCGPVPGTDKRVVGGFIVPDEASIPVEERSSAGSTVIHYPMEPAPNPRFEEPLAVPASLARDYVCGYILPDQVAREMADAERPSRLSEKLAAESEPSESEKAAEELEERAEGMGEYADMESMAGGATSGDINRLAYVIYRTGAALIRAIERGSRGRQGGA